MTTYFTSDLHISHRLVAKIRGFQIENSDTADLEAHDQAIASAFSVVKPDDIVWVQGDICVSNRAWTIALELISKLPGRKRLISGNHDPVASLHKDAWKYQRAALEVFETVQDFATIRLAGKTVLLSHYPYAGKGSEGTDDHGQPRSGERYTEFRLTDCGRVLLHGHTHGKEKLHFSERGTPQIHVGMDAWDMKLVSQYEVERLLEEASSQDDAKIT